MAGVELKIRILRKSISTFSNWLDDCDQLLTSIPTELEQCSALELRELALKYKVRELALAAIATLPYCTITVC